jgi:hypothetical protein
MGNVISTEAANSLTVRCAVERLLYFAIVIVLAVVLLFAIVVVLAVVLLVVIPEGDLLLSLPLPLFFCSPLSLFLPLFCWLSSPKGICFCSCPCLFCRHVRTPVPLTAPYRSHFHPMSVAAVAADPIPCPLFFLSTPQIALKRQIPNKDAAI